MDHSHGGKWRDRNLQRDGTSEGTWHWRHARWNQKRAEFECDIYLGRCGISQTTKSRGVVGHAGVGRRRIRIVAHEYQSRVGERPDLSTGC
jgi:hypothetical protein